jgi:hypothetical protein
VGSEMCISDRSCRRSEGVKKGLNRS